MWLLDWDYPLGSSESSFFFNYVLISTDTAVLSPKIKEYQQGGVIYSVAEIIKASKNM